MAHVMKYTRASCGHMFAHFDRKAHNITNENLDRTRSHLNYNLATHQRMEQGEFIKTRCSEVYCQNRKDVNVMCTWVVTAPKDLPEREYKDFFKTSYEFMSNRYGKENIISAYVHNDEKTPHLHFAFVPITFDEKKGRYKVSAKEVVNRYDLQRFHSDLQRCLEKELGHEVNVLNEATKEGNKSIEELKRGTAQKELEAIKSQIMTEKEVRAVKIKKSLVRSNKAVIEGTPEELGALKAAAAKVEGAEKVKREAEQAKREAEKAKREALAYEDEARRKYNWERDSARMQKNSTITTLESNLDLFMKRNVKLEAFKKYALEKYPQLEAEFNKFVKSKSKNKDYDLGR